MSFVPAATSTAFVSVASGSLLSPALPSSPSGDTNTANSLATKQLSSSGLCDGSQVVPDPPSPPSPPVTPVAPPAAELPPLVSAPPVDFEPPLDAPADEPPLPGLPPLAFVPP